MGVVAAVPLPPLVILVTRRGTMTELTVGTVGEFERVVEPTHTAQHLGSGSVAVLSTPTLILWLEEAAVRAVDHALPPGHATVGTWVDVRHLAATPVGMRVAVRAELVAVAGRRLTFRVSARDEREPVGEGTHERAVIDVARFAERVRGKGR